MIIRKELGSRGRIVIPKEIRKFLNFNLKRKEKIIFEVKENEVILKKAKI